MPDDIDVIFVIFVIYDIYDMYGGLTHTICMYVNMGVKRSVMTSGMQPTIVDILQKCVKGQKLKYPVTCYQIPKFSQLYFFKPSLREIIVIQGISQNENCLEKEAI